MPAFQFRILNMNILLKFFHKERHLLGCDAVWLVITDNSGKCFDSFFKVEGISEL
jgi:hypothetical protein